MPFPICFEESVKVAIIVHSKRTFFISREVHERRLLYSKSIMYTRYLGRRICSFGIVKDELLLNAKLKKIKSNARNIFKEIRFSISGYDLDFFNIFQHQLKNRKPTPRKIEIKLNSS